MSFCCRCHLYTITVVRDQPLLLETSRLPALSSADIGSGLLPFLPSPQPPRVCLEGMASDSQSTAETHWQACAASPLLSPCFLNVAPPTEQLKHPLFYHSFCGSEVQARPGWVLCLRSPRAALEVSSRLRSHLWLGRERSHFLAHRRCWQNSFLRHCRTEGPSSLLAVQQGHPQPLHPVPLDRRPLRTPRDSGLGMFAQR